MASGNGRDEAVREYGASLDEAAGAFLGNVPYTLEDGPSGMNNTTKRIRAGGRPYILRIYNTHGDPAKAGFEHAVLRKLAERKPGLGFRVPEPLPAATGETVVLLPATGKLAALFAYIEGRRPELLKPAEAEAFGEAAGELMKAMAAVGEAWGPGLEPQYPPYYELGSAHPSFGLKEVAGLCAEPPEELQVESANLCFLSGEIDRIRLELDGLRQLPHQLIHGDLNASNALARPDGTIAALLDFEFATVDLRAMEPAVCLWSLLPGSKMEAASEEAVWESIAAFWRGFGRQVRLLPEETAVLPLLMQLRSLDVFIHFLGRYVDGVDDKDVIAGQIPDTANRMAWVSANRERLVELFRGR